MHFYIQNTTSAPFGNAGQADAAAYSQSTTQCSRLSSGIGPPPLPVGVPTSRSFLLLPTPHDPGIKALAAKFFCPSSRSCRLEDSMIIYCFLGGGGARTSSVANTGPSRSNSSSGSIHLQSRRGKMSPDTKASKFCQLTRHPRGISSIMLTVSRLLSARSWPTTVKHKPQLAHFDHVTCQAYCYCRVCRQQWIQNQEPPYFLARTAASGRKRSQALLSASGCCTDDNKTTPAKAQAGHDPHGNQTH